MGITTQLFEEKYPGLAAFTAILEWVGIIIIFLGFFVLLSEIFRAGCYTLRQRKLYWRQLKAERANRKFALSNTLNSKSAHVMEVTPATPKHRTSESEGGKLVDNYEDEQNLANDMLSMEKDKQKRSLERRLKARRKKNKKSKVQPMSIEQTVESDTAGLKDSDALKVHPSTSKNAKEASVREPEESSK